MYIVGMKLDPVEKWLLRTIARAPNEVCEMGALNPVVMSLRQKGLVSVVRPERLFNDDDTAKITLTKKGHKHL